MARVVEIDTLMVGAGPQALTVAARWACDRPASTGRLLVVDPAGSWLCAWEDQFRRQRIGALRSPGVHHPEPDEMAFVRASARRDAPSSCSRPVGPLRRPATDAFAEFTRGLVERTGLGGRVMAGTVDELRQTRGGPHPLRWSARLADGTTARARQVIWAGNPRRRRVPRGVELGTHVVHSDMVDVAQVRPGESVAVLGGGQTAGQLALEAHRAGADVALISRGGQRVADLDVDAGWLMEDHLGPFRQIADPRDRLPLVERAARGSMTADLVAALDRSSVQRFAGVGSICARSVGCGASVGFAGAELGVDRVWVATGSTPDLRAAPPLARLAANGAAQVEGRPVLDRELRWLEGLHVVGALAALTLGPAAGNLGGARAAADSLAGLGP